MVKYTIGSLLALTIATTSVSAFALTSEEMNQPGSAVAWYKDDADMKELDVADYMFSIHSKKEVSQAKIDKVEQCLNDEMKEKYSTAKETDSNAPSLMALLKKCKA